MPAGLEVLHECDSPPCCNPDHLFLGTKADNVRDMVRKNRQARGERHGLRRAPDAAARGEQHGGARLSTEAVREMRRLYTTGSYLKKDLAERFGVGPTTAGLIVRRKAWKHV